MNLNLTNWADLLKRHLSPTRPPLLPRLSRKTEPPISKFLRLCNTPNFPPLCPLEVLNPDPSNFQLTRLWLIPRSTRVPLPLSFVMSPVTVVFFCVAA
jgi:hypothetical protein